MKKNLMKLAVVLMTMVFMVGCSRVTVPPASLGKEIGQKGYDVGVKETGKYWIPIWNNMVILDLATQTFDEPMSVRMADNLELNFNLRFRSRVQGTDKVINSMFNDIKHDRYNITLRQVYNVYGRDVVTNTARSVVSKYKSDEVPVNFDKITLELHNRISSDLKNSPLVVSNVTMAEVIYPPVINDAIEAQANRRLAIETEENQQAIERVKKRNEMELAEADRKIRIIRAEALREENRITSEGLSERLLQYRQMEVMEELGKSNNVIYYPYSADGSVGLSNRIYSK